MRRVRWAAPGSAGDCEHPLEVYDDVTELALARVRCKQRSTDKCATCGARHRRNIARVGRSGFVDSPNSRAFMVTLTAPGEDVLPWDYDQCVHGEDESCSGPEGCRVLAGPAIEWHASLGQRWSWFVTYLRRALPGVDVQFMKTYEWHERGVLHAHILFRFVGVVSERRARAAVRLASARWGFGQQLKVKSINMSDPLSCARAAGYCAKYVTKMLGTDRRTLDTSTGELVRVPVRAWSSSGRWGDSLKSIVDRQRQWTLSAGVCNAPALLPAQTSGDAVGIALDLNSDFYTGWVGSSLVDGFGTPTAM